MVPGLIAGEYRRDELVVDAAALASRADAELIVEEVDGVEAPTRSLHLSDGRTLEYDVASLDVGSVAAGQPEVPFVRAKAPDDLRSALDHLRSALESPTRRGAVPESSGVDPPDSSTVDPPERSLVVVVGGGAAGVELAAAVRARLPDRPSGGVDVRIVEEGRRLLPRYRPGVGDRVAEALRARGIDVRVGRTFDAADEPAALLVWAAGSAAPAFLERSGLPVDTEGFVRVDETLRVLDHADLFAAGDCASVQGHDLPKAGVHAVRQAPILFENLVRTSEDDGAGLRRYEPQSDFLTLLNLGDGTALGTKWGFVVEGRWVRRLKDFIDRRFVERFR